MSYLGLDYGQKHIGVAIATDSLAEPLTTVSTSSALSSIKSLIQKQGIKAVIIGAPDNPHPTLHELAHSLSSLNIPVYFADETLTSHDARLSLRHTTPTRRKNLEHAVSAALILQSWLDKHQK
jgi:putative Holliday junction resolvase